MIEKGQIQVTREIILSKTCDRCGNQIPNEVMLWEGVDIDWTLHEALDRDGGGCGISYQANLCKKCVPLVVEILQKNGIFVRENEFTH